MLIPRRFSISFRQSRRTCSPKLRSFQLFFRTGAVTDESEPYVYVFIQNAPIDDFDFLGLACGSGWNDPFVPDNPGGYPFGGACQNHDDCYEAMDVKLAKRKQIVICNF